VGQQIFEHIKNPIEMRYFFRNVFAECKTLLKIKLFICHESNLVFRKDKLGKFRRSGVVLKIENVDDGDL
jgi:hypothetical protein